MRQLRRLNSTSRSPIFSHFGETLSGVSTVRAYKAQDRFIDSMNYKIDENLLYYYPDTVSNRFVIHNGKAMLKTLNTIFLKVACYSTRIYWKFNVIFCCYFDGNSKRFK